MPGSIESICRSGSPRARRFTATVIAGAQRAGTATVSLRSDDAQVATREITLPQGLTPVALDARIEDPGTHVIRASISVPAIRSTVNNTLDRAAIVVPRTRVLYVEGAPASARYLSGALKDAGFDVVRQAAVRRARNGCRLRPVGRRRAQRRGAIGHPGRVRHRADPVGRESGRRAPRGRRGVGVSAKRATRRARSSESRP